MSQIMQLPMMQTQFNLALADLKSRRLMQEKAFRIEMLQMVMQKLQGEYQKEHDEKLAKRKKQQQLTATGVGTIAGAGLGAIVGPALGVATAGPLTMGHGVGSFFSVTPAMGALYGAGAGAGIGSNLYR